MHIYEASIYGYDSSGMTLGGIRDGMYFDSRGCHSGYNHRVNLVAFLILFIMISALSLSRI
jgi:hypothetical protein